MAAAAAVEIHPRPEAVGDDLDLLEVLLADGEELELTGSETGQGTSSPWRITAHARVDRIEHRTRAGGTAEQ
jgi:hypothetical protein